MGGEVGDSGRGATLALLTASSLWGTTGTASVLSGTVADPAVVGAARLAVGGLSLVAVYVVWRRLRGADALWAARRWVLVAGCAAALYQAAFFSAVASTGVAVGTLVVLGTAPIACGLLGRWWTGERLASAWLVATGCAVAGCALMVLPGAGARMALTGVLLATAAGACYGVYTVSAKRLLSMGHEPLGVLAASLAVGAVVLSPVLLREPGPLLDLSGLLLVGWLGIAATALAYVLFARGLGGVTAATAGTLSLAEPLTAAALGIVLLGERPSATTAAGAGLVFVGLALAALAARPRRRRTVGQVLPVAAT